MGTPVIIVKPAHQNHINYRNFDDINFLRESMLPKVAKKTNEVKLVPCELEPRHAKWTS